MNEQYAIIFQRNAKLLTERMMKQRVKIRFISQVSYTPFEFVAPLLN